MRVRLLGGFAALLAVSYVLAPAPAPAAIAPAVPEPQLGVSGALYDVRQEMQAAVPTNAQRSAMAELAAAAGSGTRATWDSRFGTPRTLARAGGWLTDAQTGDAVSVARGWIDSNRAAFGLSADAVAALVVTRNHELTGTGTRVVNFTQTFAGVPAVRGGQLGVAVAGDGRVLSYAGSPARFDGLAAGFDLSAADAVEAVVSRVAPAVSGYTAQLGRSVAGYTEVAKGPFSAQSYVKRAAFPTASGVRPAFRVLFVKALDEAWDVVVDADTGTILYRASLVAHDSEGTVYENYPGAPKGGAAVVKPFGPNAESPSGYVDPTGVAGLPGPTTLGNNASTYANYSNFLVPADSAPRPVSATSQFNYPYAQNWAKSQGATVPPSYALDLDPAATNLFWHHNRIHDEFYRLGFTESGGNFQVNNGDAGGQGADPILGLVHAGALTGGAPTYTGRDNAYMLTLPDGIPPWSGMLLWEPINDSFEGPYSDGNFDATVIEHEYSHGLSNRYVAQEDNSLGAHQSGSMGEGWGDWYALNYLHSNELDSRAVVGAFVTGNGVRGIRNWSYDDNPTGFGDIGYDLGGAEVHSDGEIWTAILWDMRKALVDRYGQRAGGEIAARLVTDAMPLSPPDPSFVDMRDAIRTALDNRYHQRSDYKQLVGTVFTAFAHRGLGLGATSESAVDTDPTPAYDHIDPALNGTLTGAVVNASTGQPVLGARIMIGAFEARVTPLRVTSSTGRFAAPVVGGRYQVTIQAPGFGTQTYPNVSVTAGRTTALRFSLSPNLASKSNGATIEQASTAGADKLLDDTEASSWAAPVRTGNAVIKLATPDGAPAAISAVQVSAFTSSRFEGLRDFTVQTSTDGTNWQTVLARSSAFSYATPRPTAPDLHYKLFTLDKPVTARYVRFWTDAALGETKTQAQAAEVQVFSRTVKDVEPLPPQPPDAPVTDEGVIATGNPTTGTVDDTTGVTATEFRTACAIPASQGTDGWVTKLPDSFGDGAHKVVVSGDSPAPYDLDLYFYNASCELIGSAASSAADESGTLPSGTTWVLSQLWLGAAVPITLTATDTQ